MGKEELSFGSPVSAAQFEAVYQSQVSYVWDFLRYLGVPPRDTEDVSHDVFIVVYRQYHQYDPSRPIRPWITGIAYRVASDYRRRAHRYREVISDEVPAVEPGPDADTKLTYKQARQILLQALESMNDEQRAVFFLHEIEEYSVVEIASMLQTPLNTLYTRLRRARMQFTDTINRLQRRGGGR